MLGMKAIMRLVEAALVFYSTSRGSTPADWVSSAILQHMAGIDYMSAVATSPSTAWMLSQGTWETRPTSMP